MLFTRRGFHAFMDYDLNASLRQQLLQIEDAIMHDRAVLELEEEEYVKAKVSESTRPLLVLRDAEMQVTTKEADIPARYFPSIFSVDDGRSYRKPVYAFHIPFDGDSQLFRFKPTTWIMRSDEVDVSDGSLIFELLDLSGDANSLTKERDETIQRLKGQADNINKDLTAHNASLTSHIRLAVKRAKDNFSKGDDMLAKLSKR